MSEFDLIKKYFSTIGAQRTDVLLAVGDDAAIIQPPADQQLVVALDTLVGGVHFPENTPAHAVGYKCLAVNLSDLAAMGATPAWATIGISLPTADETWIREFARGFSELAQHCNLQLVGGDTTHGPLSISVQVAGYVPAQQALLRSGAQVGDAIYVSGCIGDGGLGLKAALGEWQSPAIEKLNYPQPRLQLGEGLRGIATACIDISDGLQADLRHILQASHVGAVVNVDSIPLSDELREDFFKLGAWPFVLNSGDDYELCFTVPREKIHLLSALSLGVPLSCIGQVTAPAAGLQFVDDAGDVLELPTGGYDHFQD